MSEAVAFLDHAASDAVKDAAGLHIGYLVQQFPPEVGAGPARVVEMAREWLAAGARVTVFTGMPNRPYGRIHDGYRGRLWMEEDFDGIRVVRTWLFAHGHGFVSTLLNNTSFMLTSAISTLMRGRNLDVLIASEPPFFPHIAGAAAAAVMRVPLVLEVRDLWPDYMVQMGLARRKVLARSLFALERVLFQRADHVVVVTSSFRKRVIEKGVAPDRVDVISNGVDTGLYYPATEPPPIPALERRDGEFIVGYLGNMGAGQGLDAVVQAAALLAAEEDDTRFVLAGDGPTRARITELVAELGLNSVALHPPIPKAATRAFYNACDACLVPLAPVPVFQETVPSKLFEVMACERPVVLCAEGEAGSIVGSSGGGVVAKPGDPRDIADALRRLRALSADERAAMGRRGRSFVERHYRRDALARAYLAVLAGVSRSGQ